MRHRTYPATAVIRRADGRREQCLAVTARASLDDDGSEVVTYDPPIVLAAGDSVTITPGRPADASVFDSQRLAPDAAGEVAPEGDIAMLEQRIRSLRELYEETKRREAEVCRQADALQGDLEDREAALGRAMSLLRAVWDESGEGTGVVVSHVPDGANHWSDVLRWVADDPSDATVNDKTEEQSMEREEVIEHLSLMLAGSQWAEKDRRVLEEAERLIKHRWSGFSEEEMRELRAGAVQRHEGSKAVPAEYRERAGRLATELRKEFKRREAERVSYRGPGIYRHVGGEEYEVLGKTPASAESEQVVMRRITDAPGDLLAESLAEFNSQVVGADWGRTPADVVHAPRYTWVREA